MGVVVLLGTCDVLQDRQGFGKFSPFLQQISKDGGLRWPPLRKYDVNFHVM